MITLGLSQINVGKAVTDVKNIASMSGLEKLGKTYQDTCKMSQPQAEITEHFEEGAAAPEVRKKKRKMPQLTFSIMNPDVALLTDYVGGTSFDSTAFGMDGTEKVENKAIQVVTEQGLDIYIPNADIEAVINAEFSAKGLMLVDFTVTPCAVTSGKPFIAKPKV